MLSAPQANNSRQEAHMCTTSTPRRLREMMERQGVDVLEFRYDGVGATFETARRACADCRSIDACLGWLSAEASGKPDFCPNRNLFERFKSAQAGG
jgi:hypothetical protein